MANRQFTPGSLNMQPPSPVSPGRRARETTGTLEKESDEGIFEYQDGVQSRCREEGPRPEPPGRALATAAYQSLHPDSGSAWQDWGGVRSLNWVIPLRTIRQAVAWK